MGNKNGKSQKKQSNNKPSHSEWPGVPNSSQNNQNFINSSLNKAKLSEKDLEFLSQQTGQTKSDIKILFEKFMTNNPDGKLDKNEFIKLYSSLRPESAEFLDEISSYVFKAFDTDQNGSIDFNEFMISYSLTSRGDLRKKLEYAFALYDLDNNGYLDREELREVINGMLDLLGASKRSNDPAVLAQECIKELDSTNDGLVSKQEFIEGLLRNYSLRALMSPFN